MAFYIFSFFYYETTSQKLVELLWKNNCPPPHVRCVRIRGTGQKCFRFVSERYAMSAPKSPLLPPDVFGRRTVFSKNRSNTDLTAEVCSSQTMSREKVSSIFFLFLTVIYFSIINQRKTLQRCQI